MERIPQRCAVLQAKTWRTSWLHAPKSTGGHFQNAKPWCWLYVSSIGKEPRRPVRRQAVLWLVREQMSPFLWGGAYLNNSKTLILPNLFNLKNKLAASGRYLTSGEPCRWTLRIQRNPQHSPWRAERIPQLPACSQLLAEPSSVPPPSPVHPTSAPSLPQVPLGCFSPKGCSSNVTVQVASRRHRAHPVLFLGAQRGVHQPWAPS